MFCYTGDVRTAMVMIVDTESQYVGNNPQTTEGSLAFYNAIDLTATWSVASCSPISCTYSWNLNFDGTSYGPITWSAIFNGPTQLWIVDFAVVTVSLTSTSHTALLVKFP